MLVRPGRATPQMAVGGLARPLAASTKAPNAAALGAPTPARPKSHGDGRLGEAARRSRLRKLAQAYGRLGSTLLEARSISPKVETEYRRLYALFEKWCRRKGLPLQSLAERDGALARYGTHLYLLGHPAADFGKNRAAPPSTGTTSGEPRPTCDGPKEHSADS